MRKKEDESFWRTVATAVVGFVGFWIFVFVLLMVVALLFFDMG